MSLARCIFLFTLLALASCSPVDEPGDAVAGDTPLIVDKPSEGGIPWFKGSVEEAFATAKTRDKPVFLYWGAQWCPPCQELKSTIFRRHEFIAQSKLFVPVYLDGDSERAQKYGEQFAVVGYPTVIIFDPQGVELTRIPGGMDIQQYLGVLQLALNALRPVKDLVQAVQSGEKISDDDWRLLASYSWSQDGGMTLDESGNYQILQALATACPERLAAAKGSLQIQAILSWAGDEERDESLLAQYRSQLQDLLDKPTLARENLVLFIAGGAMMMQALGDDEHSTKTREKMTALFAAAIQDQSIGLLTRIEALFAWVGVNKTSLPEDQPLSLQQQQWVKAQAATLRPQVDSYQLHAALNTLSGIYLNAGMMEEARATMREGIETSSQPYYFMSGMAYLETKTGHSEAAIAWHKKAWEAAQGPATRIQWGSSYMYALIKLKPDDIESLESAGTIVLAELAQQKDGLYQRNSGRIDKLSERLLVWVEPAEHAKTGREQRQRLVDKLRGEMDKLCQSSAAGGEGHNTCESFLVPI